MSRSASATQLKIQVRTFAEEGVTNHLVRHRDGRVLTAHRYHADAGKSTPNHRQQFEARHTLEIQFRNEQVWVCAAQDLQGGEPVSGS
jgi:hypothetical protein